MVADPLVRYDVSPSQGPICSNLLLHDAVNVAPAEGLWMPSMWMKTMSVELRGVGISAISAQLYGSNDLAPFNQQVLTVAGTLTTNDVIALKFLSPVGGSITHNYTVKAGDTTATILAASLAADLGTDNALAKLGITAQSVGAVITVSYPSILPGTPSQWTSPVGSNQANFLGITYAQGGNTETIAIAAGTNGSLLGAAITTAGLTQLSLVCRWIKARVASFTGTSYTIQGHGVA